MKKDQVRVWKRVGWSYNPPKKPQFYLTDKEKKDGESSIIHRWLDLADRLFESDDSEPLALGDIERPGFRPKLRLAPSARR
jgi:hypothetical protein